MRGLSVQQPYASLIAIGAKSNETRSWRTTYRGLVAIHASADYPMWARELERVPAFATALAGVPRPLPLGKVVALVELAACYQCFLDTADTVGHPESLFGNFAAGRYRFVLRNVRPLRTPIACKGRLGLWSVEPALAVRILEQAA